MRSYPITWHFCLLYFYSLTFNIFYLCVCVPACMQCLWSSDVGIRSSGSEVSCDCGLPLLGSGNWTEILWGLNPEQQPSLHLERTTSRDSTKRLLEATLPCWTVHTQQLLSEDKIVIQAYHSSPLITLSCIFLSGLEAPFSVTLTLLSSLENEQTQPHQHELAASLVLTSSSGDYFVCVCNALARVRRSDIVPPSLIAFFIITEHSCKPEMVRGEGSVAMASVTGIQNGIQALLSQDTDDGRFGAALRCVVLISLSSSPKSWTSWALLFLSLLPTEKSEDTSDTLTVLFDVHQRISGKWLRKADRNAQRSCSPWDITGNFQLPCSYIPKWSNQLTLQRRAN